MKKVERGQKEKEEEVVKPYIGNTVAVQSKLSSTKKEISSREVFWER